MRSAVRLGILSLLVCLVLGGTLPAQTAAGSLHGQVTDPMGAVVVKATITAKGANGQTASSVSSSKGTYEIKTLAPGAYTLRIVAKGFSPEIKQVTIAPGAAQTLDIALEIAVEQQSVNVEEDSPTVSTDAASNANSVVIKGKDLDALSDNPDDLESDLQALAGPSAGPNGGEIYIDGFSNGTLPPKSSIREIRINQNPFSAQYDRIGYGRIEVFTKPGTDSYHGMFHINGNDSVLNSRNPYLKSGTEQPGYHRLMYFGNLSGPINSKSSFFVDFRRFSDNEVSIYNATVPCQMMPNLCDAGAPLDKTTSYTGAVASPSSSWEIAPRIDYQVSKNNTLSARYEYESSDDKNGGISTFSLPSQAQNSSDYAHHIRISDTQVLTQNTINETRLQWIKSHSDTNPLLVGVTVEVPDAFTTGGVSSPASYADQQHIEFQNYTSHVHGTHFIRFGGRVRRNSQSDYSLDNAGGTFHYRDLASYMAGVWDQYSITRGNAYASVSQIDAGLYAEDDWRFHRNMTLSYGLRFETQENVGNHANFAPRVGFAWGLGKGASPKTVLRAGVGMFYDRFSQGNVMQVNRTSGADPQLSYTTKVYTPGTPDPSTMSADKLVKYVIDPNLRIPYLTQYAATLERQLSRTSKLSITYIGSRAVHQLVRENLGYWQAPIASGPYQYESIGTFKQNQLMVNSNLNLNQRLSLFGFYVYGRANSNVLGNFPSDPRNIDTDWGPASFNRRHQGMIMGNISLPFGIRLNPMIFAMSGRHYNVTTGEDDNGDTIFNDRPYFASCPNHDYATNKNCYSLVDMKLGKVPANYLSGPGMFNTNLRVSKTFGLGKKKEQAAGGGAGGPGGGRGGHGGRGGRGGGFGPGPMMGGMMGGGSGQKYSLTFNASARNLLNTWNKGTPSGNLSSGNFGEARSLGGFGNASSNRRIEFGVMFNF